MRLVPSSVHRIVVKTSAGQKLNATMLLHCTSLQAEADLSELRRRIFAGGVVPLRPLLIFRADDLPTSKLCCKTADLSKMRKRGAKLGKTE